VPPPPEASKEGADPQICLCMIVRNEARVLERCLDAAWPILSAASLCDTGSEDGTGELAASWLERHGLPGRVYRHAFRDFGESRTFSIEAARRTLAEIGFDPRQTYLLFLDADMVLEIAPGFRPGNLSADIYTVLQRNAGLVYPNVRLARASLPARFAGATHEYYAAPSTARQEPLEALSIDDRNDGGSRGDKLERDRRLLEGELALRPGDPRSMFYLAQTYRGLGDFAKALFWYRRRAAAGGWFEEVWYSLYAIGLLYLETGETQQALRAFHRAIRFDSRRPEPFFHIARHLRSLGRHLLAARYARAGLACRSPSGRALFVEQTALDWGLLRELSISGFYTRYRGEGYEANERLALGRGVPAHLSALAASNSVFYAAPLPGASYASIAPALPPGFSPCNPSIARSEDGYWINCRAVSYRLDAAQAYASTQDDGLFRTRNFLLSVDRRLGFREQREVAADFPPLRWTAVRGLEDCRLVSSDGGLALTCSTAELHPSGLIQMSLVMLDRLLSPERHVPLFGHGDRLVQKNWLPFVDPVTGELQAVYSFEPMTTLAIDAASGECRPIVERATARSLGRFRGSAGPITLPDRLGGGRLFVVHEVAYQGRRYYLHRFVAVDAAWRVTRVSRPFFFRHLGIEFVCGAALAHGDEELLLTFGVEDREAWLCRLPLDDAVSLLEDLPD